MKAPDTAQHHRRENARPGRIVQEICPELSEGQAKHVIAIWVKNGVFAVRDHIDPKSRRAHPSLFVVRRPGDTWNV
jgi:hypothetical protein